MPSSVLHQLHKRLIVSCQPTPGGSMDSVHSVLGFAGSALAGGAAGLRIEGVDRVRAVKTAYSEPVIGLIKRDLADSPVRITPLLDDVEALALAGADIIAVDCTDRTRPVTVRELIACIRSHGRLAMADCATLAQAQAALAMGADVVGSTLSGYTGGPVPHPPDLDLVRALRTLKSFVIAEGRLNTPELAAQAARAGADAVVVGSAITRPDVVTSWFAQATMGAYAEC
ncbi:N-acetylmannosamine-6-phosphate 2-epimerase [Verminephrobacter aporrectodeae]|uniref:N-acetylmannosamine-6-phosphate 2-epimerase n=1 Tax=Verminephrobacter aporrectodeae TaxID=1110389 RepID=UPI0022441A6C|nr:putative N-acetylmannosamine-6-phosphate 2-epimerase [Verminephrobacter aporrectodeae]